MTLGVALIPTLDQQQGVLWEYIGLYSPHGEVVTMLPAAVASCTTVKAVLQLVVVFPFKQEIRFFSALKTEGTMYVCGCAGQMLF